MILHCARLFGLIYLYCQIQHSFIPQRNPTMFKRSDVERAHQYEGGISRRWFMAYASALGSIPLLGRSSWAVTSPSFSSDPFTLGVASGDPDHQSLVLWTRLAPDPLDPNGGMKAEPVQVTWELATDETMKTIVASGKSVATPQLGHSVHVVLVSISSGRCHKSHRPHSHVPGS